MGRENENQKKSRANLLLPLHKELVRGYYMSSVALPGTSARIAPAWPEGYPKTAGCQQSLYRVTY